MPDFNQLMEAANNVLAQLQLQPKRPGVDNRFTELASQLGYLRTELRSIVLTDAIQKTQQKNLDKELDETIDQLNGKAYDISADEAENLIGEFIAANQEATADVDKIKKELETVKEVTRILGYIDQLIKIAAAIAAKA